MNLLSVWIYRVIAIASLVVNTTRLAFCVCFDFWLGLCIALPVTAGGTSIAEFLTRGFSTGWRIFAMVLPWVFFMGLMQRIFDIRLAVLRLCETRGWLDAIPYPLRSSARILLGVMAFLIFLVTLLLVFVVLIHVHPDRAFRQELRADAITLMVLLGLPLAGLSVTVTLSRLRRQGETDV